MLPMKMKKNMAMNRGVNPGPSGPIVDMTICSSTISTELSATFCTPDGRAAACEAARKKMANVIATAMRFSRAILLNSSSVPSPNSAGHSRTSSMGGNSRPSSMVAGGLRAGRRARPTRAWSPRTEGRGGSG